MSVAWAVAKWLIGFVVGASAVILFGLLVISLGWSDYHKAVAMAKCWNIYEKQPDHLVVRPSESAGVTVEIIHYPASDGPRAEVIVLAQDRLRFRYITQGKSGMPTAEYIGLADGGDTTWIDLDGDGWFEQHPNPELRGHLQNNEQPGFFLDEW